jgi:tetratricopeptide (TPR) repeat protein
LLNEARIVDADAIDNYEGHCLFGAVHEALDNLEEALAEFQEALEIDEKDVEALEGIIRILINNEERPSALRQLRRYVAGIDRAGDPLKAARWYYQLDRLDDAEDMIRLEPEKSTKDADLSIRGLIHFERGRWLKAIADLEKSMPLDAEKCNALMTSNLMLGKAAEAIAWAEKVEGMMEIPLKLNEQADAIKKLKQRRDSIQRDLPHVDQDRSVAAIDLFLCAELLHDAARVPADVELLLEKALNRPFKLGPALALRAELMIEKGNLTNAFTAAEDAIKTSPREARGYFVRGRIRFERSQYDAARADLLKAVELSGEENARHLHWLASTLMAVREPAEALKCQKKAAGILPRNNEINDQLLRIQAVNDKK